MAARHVKISGVVGLLTVCLPIWTTCGPVQYITIAGSVAFFTWTWLTDWFGWEKHEEE